MAISAALLGACLGACSDQPIFELRDRVKTGMSRAELTGLLDEPNERVSVGYRWSAPDMIMVDFVRGKVDYIEQHKGHSPVQRGMTEQQVSSLMGNPDWMKIFYRFGDHVVCQYNFENDRLGDFWCNPDSQLDRRYESIGVGRSRSSVERYFGITQTIAYTYGRGQPPDFVFFRNGKVLYDEVEVKKGATINEVIDRRGKPLEVCDLYDAPAGGYGWSFCYDDRGRLVRKEWAAYPVP